ncbi:MAG: hypothetical protein U0105_25890 [Candidatus Obscuribacterales bacterium]
MKRQYRQGDILLDEAVPRPQFSLAENQRTDLVLAVGERTGHAHRIQCADALLSNLFGQRYLWLEEDARLVHEEHDPISIPRNWSGLDYGYIVSPQVDESGRHHQRYRLPG